MVGENCLATISLNFKSFGAYNLIYYTSNSRDEVISRCISLLK